MDFCEEMAEEKDFDDVKNNKHSNENENVEYKPPRWFQNSFVDKTLNLFYPGYEGKKIGDRNLKEK